MFNVANLQGQLQRAQAAFQAGRHDDAWIMLAPLRAAIADNRPALRLYAVVAQRAGQIDAAADALHRIIDIERGPPEIIGALADMLGEAGRHEEALALWTRLAGLQPGVADAHLNRAISAANAGKAGVAIAAADEGLKRFPGHARLLATRAMALKNADRIDEAVAAFERAVAADPDRALTRHNQAVTLRASCRFDAACEAFTEAERLGMTGAQFLSNWGSALLEAGRADEAGERFRRALAIDPTHDETRKALTRLRIEYRGGKQAFDHYEAWAKRSNQAGAWTDWVSALVANKRFAEAAEIAREAPAAIAEDGAFHATTQFAAGMSGDAGKALEALQGLPAAARDDPPLQLARAQLALRARQAQLAADLALACAERDPRNQSAWSLLGIAWRLLDDPREQWLCDYQRLVMVADVPSPDGLQPGEFAHIVAAALDPLHQTLAAPGDQSLEHGTQTSGRLFSRPDPVIRAFRQAVLDSAAEQVSRLADDPSHPFLSRKSARFDFAGSWSVRLRGGGGKHVPHFHGEGWMSSAYYARLPAAVAAGEARHEGWIEFGRPPAMFDLDLEPRRLVEPKPGRLVLFPSYLWHGTIPFPAGSGDRLTAAFDYLPA